MQTFNDLIIWKLNKLSESFCLHSFFFIINKNNNSEDRYKNSRYKLCFHVQQVDG